MSDEEFEQEEPATCQVCGSTLEWVDCLYCDGGMGDAEGWDTCPDCDGEGGWLECPNAVNHTKGGAQ